MNEFDYIDKYFRPLTNKFALNLKNDAAIFNQNSSFDLIISTDSLAEGIHFFGNEDPADIAKKRLLMTNYPPQKIKKCFSQIIATKNHSPHSALRFVT